MRMKKFAAAFAGAALVASAPAYAVTEIQWWNAMTGALGEQVKLITDDFNASQSQYKVVPVYKGGYADTMAAGIAAARTGDAYPSFGGTAGQETDPDDPEEDSNLSFRKNDTY